MLRRMAPASRRVLVQFAHPVLERSQVNRPLIDAVASLPLPWSNASTSSLRSASKVGCSGAIAVVSMGAGERG